jgi:broad specificity phosphatase PhoE
VETRPATGQRMLLFWNDLLEELASSPPSLSNVLISNHGASIRYFLQALRNQEPRVVAFPKVDSGEEHLPNCSITTLEMALHEDGSWSGALLEWGASAHLRVKTATGDDAA